MKTGDKVTVHGPKENFSGTVMEVRPGKAKIKFEETDSSGTPHVMWLPLDQITKR